MENKRILFAEVSDGEVKKLLDNSAQRNTKISKKIIQERSTWVRLEKLLRVVK